MWETLGGRCPVTQVKIRFTATACPRFLNTTWDSLFVHPRSNPIELYGTVPSASRSRRALIASRTSSCAGLNCGWPANPRCLCNSLPLAPLYSRQTLGRDSRLVEPIGQHVGIVANFPDFTDSASHAAILRIFLPALISVAVHQSIKCRLC
jgi:hypothetical protein